MTEPRAIDAWKLRARLPQGWRVENDGRAVFGYADAGATTLFLVGQVPACFSIRPTGDLWTATWKAPHALGDGSEGVSDRVTGARERCVAWVVEKASRT